MELKELQYPTEWTKKEQMDQRQSCLVPIIWACISSVHTHFNTFCMQEIKQYKLEGINLQNFKILRPPCSQEPDLFFLCIPRGTSQRSPCIRLLPNRYLTSGKANNLRLQLKVNPECDRNKQQQVQQKPSKLNKNFKNPLNNKLDARNAPLLKASNAQL